MPPFLPYRLPPQAMAQDNRIINYPKPLPETATNNPQTVKVQKLVQRSQK